MRAIVVVRSGPGHSEERMSYMVFAGRGMCF